MSEHWKLLGESGLAEDEEGNIVSASEAFPADDPDDGSKQTTGSTSAMRRVTEHIDKALNDKASPGYWLYYYDARYCGPDPRAYCEEMARRHGWNGSDW